MLFSPPVDIHLSMPITWSSPRFPVAAFEIPAIAMLFPVMRCPHVAGFAEIVSLVPDVLVAIPMPITRCPGVADTGRRYWLDNYRRRGNSDIDFDVGAGGYDSRRGCRTHR